MPYRDRAQSEEGGRKRRVIVEVYFKPGSIALLALSILLMLTIARRPLGDATRLYAIAIAIGLIGPFLGLTVSTSKPLLASAPLLALLAWVCFRTISKLERECRPDMLTIGLHAAVSLSFLAFIAASIFLYFLFFLAYIGAWGGSSKFLQYFIVGLLAVIIFFIFVLPRLSVFFSHVLIKVKGPLSDCIGSTASTLFLFGAMSLLTTAAFVAFVASGEQFHKPGGRALSLLYMLEKSANEIAYELAPALLPSLIFFAILAPMVAAAHSGARIFAQRSSIASRAAWSPVAFGAAASVALAVFWYLFHSAQFAIAIEIFRRKYNAFLAIARLDPLRLSTNAAIAWAMISLPLVFAALRAALSRAR